MADGCRPMAVAKLGFRPTPRHLYFHHNLLPPPSALQYPPPSRLRRASTDASHHTQSVRCALRLPDAPDPRRFQIPR